VTAPGEVIVEGAPRAGARQVLSLGTVWQTLGPLASLLILCFLIWLKEPVFIDHNNLLNVARQASLTAILGTGMTFVILTGGVDLSVGSMVALASVAGGLLMVDHGWSMWPAVVVMILVGGL
jgi:ribose transport system permease protein